MIRPIGRRLHCNPGFYHCLVIISISDAIYRPTTPLRRDLWSAHLVLALICALTREKASSAAVFQFWRGKSLTDSLPKTRSVRGFCDNFFSFGLGLIPHRPILFEVCVNLSQGLGRCGVASWLERLPDLVRWCSALQCLNHGRCSPYKNRNWPTLKKNSRWIFAWTSCKCW